MNAYKASIRLMNADSRDYEKLDKDMEAAAFKQQPAPDDGREYLYKGTGTFLEVTTATHQAAHRSGRQYSFTVTPRKTVA